MTTIDNQQAVTDQLCSRFGSSVRIGQDCDLASDLCVEIDDDGVLILGDRVSVRRGTTIQVHRGATVSTGNLPTLGWQETITSTEVIDDPRTVREYSLAYNQVMNAALDRRASLNMITECLKDLS